MKKFMKTNAFGAIVALSAILTAAIMVMNSDNAVITNVGFFLLLALGVSAATVRTVRFVEKRRTTSRISMERIRTNLIR